MKRCDQIITNLGFDKEWGRYFHNSRRLLGNNFEQSHITVNTSPSGEKPSLKINDTALAIKELRVYKVNSDDVPQYFKLHFEKAHYKGWFDTIVSTPDFWDHEAIE
jgi:hypothetical protein